MAFAFPTVFDLLFVMGLSVGLAIFPVFPTSIFSSAVCRSLEKGNPKTPKVLLMVLSTFAGALLALAIAVAALMLYTKIVPSFEELGWLFLCAIAGTFVIFPLVFLMAFYYEMLQKERPKAPKFFLRLYACCIGVLAAVLLAYLYIKYVFLPVAAPFS